MQPTQKRDIFWKSWIFVGHQSDLRNPGDYITAAFCGQRIFVIRSSDGELKSFFNVCQHRGHSLLKGKGTVSPNAELSETEHAAMDYFADILGPEDVSLIEDVQLGLSSLGYHQGRIMVDPERSEISEHALYHFQNLVMREMKEHI